MPAKEICCQPIANRTPHRTKFWRNTARSREYGVNPDSIPGLSWARSSPNYYFSAKF